MNLPETNKENPFSTPPDYFDHLPQQIAERIRQNRKEPFFLLKPSFLIPSAAILAGVILVVMFFLKRDTPSAQTLLSDTDVRQLIDNPDLYNLDESFIEEKYLSAIPDSAMFVQSAVRTDEIKSYLEESDDIADLMNEH